MQNPIINPAVNSIAYPLQQANVWLNDQGPPHNHSIYAGNSGPSINTNENTIGQYMSHLLQRWFNDRAEYSPGYLVPYVMSPFAIRQYRSSEWTIPEIKMLIPLGYSLNPNFETSSDLFPFDPALGYGTATNAQIISNSPPYRSDYNVTADMHTVYDELQSSAPAELAVQIETENPDFQITNLNTDQNPVQTVLVINLDNDLSLIDPDSDDISVYPESVFGIMGVGTGNNDHDRLILDPTRKIFTYSPEPGFHGRAQFGFHLFDGKEKGGLEIYTIEVNKDPNYTVSPGEELIINGNFEDGTEVRTWEELDKPYSTSHEFYILPTHLSGSLRPSGMPYFRGGYMVYHSHDTYVQNDPSVQNGPENFGFSHHTTPREFTNSSQAIPDATVQNNDRYIQLSTGNFMTLRDHLIPGEFYELNFNQGFPAGNFFSPSLGVDVQLEIELIDVPTGVFEANAVQTINYQTVVEDLLPAVSSTAWQDAQVVFQFCGNEDQVLHINIRRDQSMPFFQINLDNVSLKQVSAPEFEVDAGPDLYINSSCPSVQLGVSVLGDVDWCPLEFSWSPAASLSDPSSQFPIASPAQTTTYTVTVTEPITGIQASDEVTVIVGEELVNYGPLVICDEAGLIDLLDNVSMVGGGFTLFFEGQQFDLEANSVINPAALGVGEGGVLYIIDNGGCDLVTFFDITILQGFDASNASHPNGLTVSNSQTLSGSFQFLDDLIIQDGATLTIDNSEVQFSETSRLHIEPGGRLNVNNTTLTSLNCENFWLGIYVEGIGSIPQWGSNALQHGRLFMDDCLVRNAFRGVANYGETSQLSSHGGIMRVVGSEFRNCEIAAEIKSKTNFISGVGDLPVSCRFYNTDFIIDEDNNFISSANNPVMKLRAVKDIVLSGCNFLNTNPELTAAPNNSPTKAAIWADFKSSFIMTRGCNGAPPYAYDASTGSCVSGTVTTNIKGFAYGVYGLPGFPTEIDQVTFECFRGVWYTSDALRLTRNTFRPIPADVAPITGEQFGNDPTWNVSYGAYLDGSTMFWVEGNNFDYINNPWWGEVGLIVKSSGAQENRVYRNDFTDTWMGSLAYDDNRGFSLFSGLKYDCNTMNSNSYDLVTFRTVIPYDSNWGISQWQGNAQGESAGNDFETNSILNLYHYFPSNITYFANPNESFQSWFGNVTLIEDFDFENNCESSFPSPGGPSKNLVQELGIANSSADSIKTVLNELVDDGDTEGLTTEVVLADYTEALALYYELMAISPALSEKVLIEAIDKEYDLPAPLLTLILQSNPHAAKSENVQKKLDDRLLPLEEYQREMVNEGLELVSYKEELESGYAYQRGQINFLLSQRIHEILRDTTLVDPVGDIATLIDTYRTPDHYYFLTKLYILYNDFDAAQNMLTNVGLHFDLDDRRWAEYQDYQVACEIWIDLETQNRSNLTNTERIDLELIAYRKSTMATGLAKSLLSFYDDQMFYEALVEPIIDTGGKSNKSKTSKIKQKSVYSLYPNPSRGLVFVKGVGEQGCVAEIYDASGQKVVETLLDLKTSIIDLSAFPSGVYKVSLRSIIDQSILHQDRIVIAR
jgi:hypothetical protein